MKIRSGTVMHVIIYMRKRKLLITAPNVISTCATLVIPTGKATDALGATTSSIHSRISKIPNGTATSVVNYMRKQLLLTNVQNVSMSCVTLVTSVKNQTPMNLKESLAKIP